MRLRTVLLPAALVTGCATLTEQGKQVSVYRAPLDAAPADRTMPDGCRLVAAKPPVSMPELDLEVPKDPFRVERNEAGAAGANALLVLTERTVGRRSFECPGTTPIKDCPPLMGAWFRVVVESYACTSEAITQLSTPASPHP